MELKDRKYICNTGKLPGFADGILSSLPKPGLFNISAAQTVVNNMLNLTPNIPHQNVEVKNRYISPITTGQFMQDNQKLLELFSKTPIRGESKNIGSQAAGSATGGGPGFAIGAWLGGGVLEGINAARKSADEHLLEAGTSLANINGIGYTKQNNVDVAGIMGDYDKEAGTAWLTNPGKAITMLFGRSAAQRTAENAAIHADIMQGAARDNAYTQYLRLDNAKRYGNTNDQLMYAAKDGKLPKFEDGLESAFGKVRGLANGMVSNGEVMSEDGYIHRVGKGKDNKDTRRAILRERTGVFPNQGEELFGEDISDFVWRTGDVDTGTEMLKTLNAVKDRTLKDSTLYAKNGKLPKFAAGWVGNFATSGIGALMGLELMIHAYNNKPYKPNTYVANPYETEALSTLAGLRVNPYPIMNQLRSAEARTNRAVDIAGGLSGAQRAYSRLAGLNTTLNNIANLLMNTQLLNNQYKTNYAQQALNAGNATRTARMSANQYDLDYFSKAHAARLGGIQMGARNILEQAQQYYANEFKRNQFNNTMALYRADQELKKKTDAWMMKNLGGYDINNNKTLTDSLILDMYKRGLLRRV